ncbi:MAG TPA: response regulator [Halobacteriales archaeon]|nr:response regulator [Halobacteriales archaeon]
MVAEGKPEILLVDDDPQVLDVYRSFLEGSYELRTATSGEAALDELTDETDVVLLDRRMPEMSGDEVAEAIRDRGYDCRVAMVTALTPEVDIVDMGIDDYVVKPATGSKLRNVVDSLLRWEEYDDVLTEYFELASKAAALENRSMPAPLELSEEYRRLKERLSTLEEEAQAAIETIDDADDETNTDVFESLVGDGSPPENVESAGSSR